MIKRQFRYSPDEAARRGTELYEAKIRPLVETGNFGRILAIDIESGEYALAEQTYDAAKALIDKNPDAQVWTLRIGHIAVEKFGGGDTREKK
ncbi:MAG: hypothetical protein HYX68_12335 [Planctomycetes bacterium]|jgi:hypothetical protein|nr:hypothetical protein [Planctomycetota bacterium]